MNIGPQRDKGVMPETIYNPIQNDNLKMNVWHVQFAKMINETGTL